jgi:hypothetical protein
VAFVEPGWQPDAIRDHLQSSLDEPERWRRMGRRGREWLEDRHAPDVYSRRLIELAREAVEFRLRAPGLDAAARVASEVRDWGEGAREAVDRRVREELRSLFGTEVGREAAASSPADGIHDSGDDGVLPGQTPARGP